MKWWWQDKTGLSKASAIFATILLIALGMCGVNAVAITSLVSIGGPEVGVRAVISYALITMAYIEAFAILGSLAGLLWIGAIRFWQAIRKTSRTAIGKDDH